MLSMKTSVYEATRRRTHVCDALRIDAYITCGVHSAALAGELCAANIDHIWLLNMIYLLQQLIKKEPLLLKRPTAHATTTTSTNFARCASPYWLVKRV